MCEMSGKAWPFKIVNTNFCSLLSGKYLHRLYIQSLNKKKFTDLKALHLDLRWRMAFFKDCGFSGLKKWFMCKEVNILRSA